MTAANIETDVPEKVPDPAVVMRQRIKLLATVATEPRLRAIEMEWCRTRVADWIDRWVMTYDPNAGSMPFRPMVLFRRQRELISWLDWLVEGRAEGVLEKSREIGASWLLAMYALHHWLMVPGFRTTFGSFKAEKVDQRGNADSLFEKIRIALEALPPWMKPDGFVAAEHDNYMRLLNPVNGNQIVGEVGQNMGRGGRSSLFVIDEAAFIEEPRNVSRAVSRNAEARVWASTPSPEGKFSVFYEKRQRALARDEKLVFRFHYSDDPRRTEAWVKAKRAEMDEVDWAAEQEIDYSGAHERPVILSEWIEDSVALGLRHLGKFQGHEAVAALDVGAGKAESVLVVRRGPAVVHLRAWKRPDAVDTAVMAATEAAVWGCGALLYDATGVGEAQGAILARLEQSHGIRVVGVNLGARAPVHANIIEGDKLVPASERYRNMKAWGWFTLRERARKSHEVMKLGMDHPLDDCLLLAVRDPTLEAQLGQPSWTTSLTGKKQVDKAPSGAKSPDRADAAMMSFLEIDPPIQLVW